MLRFGLLALVRCDGHTGGRCFRLLYCAAGKTLLPGYVMMHEHLIYLDHTAPVPAYRSESVPMPPLYLAAVDEAHQLGATVTAHLCSVTFDEASAIGIDDRVGTIAEGKQADMILIDGRPDEKIESVAKVAIVLRDGVAWDPEALIDSVRGTVGR